ncbi:DNA dC-_dU-editing enzyme APOBEC-3G-like [Mustela lutreola]|uniref:DNA dC->dU-editing enzyme APOBEC-3G-like n=1 Tax=Mustela lutreola TaxID=9666 RepID=UPI002797428B|nr:DNA dC->dU-editing enzyme APOBEC-3G-like [Mustela lutreola]
MLSRHAESFLLEQIQSWKLNPEHQYRVTCFLSWSPCADCAQRMAEFLGDNSHVSLNLYASRIYSLGQYEQGLRTLKRAGASITIMTAREFEHCWDTFVLHQGRSFQPWEGLDKESQKFSETLHRILQAKAGRRWGIPSSGLGGISSGSFPKARLVRGMDPWHHDPRDPLEKISPGTFLFHFPSLCYASGRKLCYLCFHVEGEGEEDSWYDLGVFQNEVYPQAPCHAEACFLSWFRDQNLPPEEHYRVTWFLSWSPCPTCAEDVIEFLEEYRNVTLSIYTARLYYFWDPDFQDGLHKLWCAGVHLDIMSFEDYEYCWETFVDHKGMRFQSWDLLRDNDLLAEELEDILGCLLTAWANWLLSLLFECLLNGAWRLPTPIRSTMNPLRREIFYHQFGNQPRAPRPFHRRKTYLCYQLKPHEGHIKRLQNKKKRHAEIRFIDHIRALQLDRSQRFEITCYLTWSPCPSCAKELAVFVQDHPHIRLRLFASRLYFHWRWKHQEGLRLLHRSGISVAVMRLQEFEDCWSNFVDHQGEPFQPWHKLEQYSESITRRLRRILEHPQNNLETNFRNLHI